MLSGVHHRWTNEHPSASSARRSTAHQQPAVGDTRGLLRGAGGARGRAAQLQAARRRAHLACCIPSRDLPSPRNHIGIAEDALLEVRWHHDLRGVERESVRGDARRHGECDLAHRERQLSRDEHHLKGATTAACTCRRSQRVALKCNRQKPAKLSCAARFGRMSLPWIPQSGPASSWHMVLQAG